MAEEKNLIMSEEEARELQSLLEFFISSNEMEKIDMYYKSRKKPLASIYHKISGRTADQYLHALDTFDEEK